jgi:hypothetical protein
MDTLKEVLSFAAAIVGLLTALIPLLARLVDKRRQAASPARARPVPVASEDEPVEVDEIPRVAARSVARVKALVKAPATALVVAGFVGLAFNLFVAGFGYVDEFVTPLSTKNKERTAAVATAAVQGVASEKAEEQDRASAVLAIVTLLSFSVACLMAIWAGFNMLQLRSYWLSMAGSIAVMPGACVCCLAGFPVGIWSLTVLLRPEVRSTFG